MGTIEYAPIENPAPAPQNGNPMEIAPRGTSAVRALAEMTKERSLVEARFAIAERRPRSIDDFRTRILATCKRPKFAETAIYAKPVGGKTISGLSIRFADEALKQYGNIETDCVLMAEDDDSQTWRVSVCDLENNVTLHEDFHVEKTVERGSSKDRTVISERTNSYGKPVYIVVATEDELKVKRDAHMSKVRRGLVLRLIPSDILEEVRETVTAVRDGADKTDPIGAKNKLVDAFLSVGVTASEISKFLGKDISKGALSPKEISDLRNIYSAVKNGEAQWKDFAPDDGSDPAPIPTGRRQKTEPAPQEPAQ